MRFWRRFRDGQPEAEAALAHAERQKRKVQEQERETSQLLDRIEVYVTENRIYESVVATLRRPGK